MIKTKSRVSWITRVSVKPAERDELREISKEIQVPIAKLIGVAISDFLAVRSSA
jgi:hypothetical protein